MEEIEKLKEMLKKSGIPFEEVEMNGGKQIIYSYKNNRVLDAVCHSFSYGHEQGLLEIMGLLTEEESKYDEVAGWLTAKDVYSRIKRHNEKVRR